MSNEEEAALSHKEEDYIHYSPAVRYGNALATIERFQGKSWEEIEPEAKEEWEEKHNRPWDEFKAIIQRAWQEARTTFLEEEPETEIDRPYEDTFQEHYQANYTDTAYTYRQYAPAYHYGYDLAVDEQLSDKSWADIEAEAQQYWQQQRQVVPWEKAQEAIQYAWQETRNRQQ